MDFYEIEGKIYFGEFTLYLGTGMKEFTPIDWDCTLGFWVTLPNVKTIIKYNIQQLF